MTRANTLSKADDSTAVFPHCHAPVEASAPASLGTRRVMPRMSKTLTVSKLANQQTECLTSPQCVHPDKQQALRTELCQPHYSARRLVAVFFSGARTSIVTDDTATQSASIKTPIQNEPALAVGCFTLLS